MKTVHPVPAPPSTKLELNNKMKDGGNNQKLILFNLGKAISAAPINNGTIQFSILIIFIIDWTISLTRILLRVTLRVVSEDPLKSFLRVIQLINCYYLNHRRDSIINLRTFSHIVKFN